MLSRLRLLPAPRELEYGGPRSAARAADARVEKDAGLPAQGYRLEISSAGIRIEHADEPGLRYARATLAEVERQSGGELPSLRIADWPDFPVRGYMLDVSRDRVPTRETLARTVELLDRLRLNHLELYTEHTFAYREHQTVWRDASPITADDLLWLDSQCFERGIELSANQNSFGHMGRWLRHERYRNLAETPDGWQTRAGRSMSAGVLAPTDESLAFVVELWRELLPNLRSRRVNIGCDETWELGQGRSRAAVEQRGRGRVYLEFLSRLLEALHAEGCEVLFWGDILRSHGDLVSELPVEDVVALAWHYEAPVDTASLDPGLGSRLAEFGTTAETLAGFSGQVGAFADSGLPFWVCPGTSTWNSLLGRLPNARGNLADAAEVGLARGASGYLITDWGDNGHLQPLAVSIPPLAYGAAVAWCLEANRDLELAPLLDALLFDDAAGELGSALERVGGAYARTGLRAANASPLQSALGAGGVLDSWGEASQSGVEATLALLADATASVERARPACADGEILCRELRAAIRLARHGAWRIARGAGFRCPSDAELRADLEQAIAEQRACWLLRSRPGGLDDSVARLAGALAEY